MKRTFLLGAKVLMVGLVTMALVGCDKKEGTRATVTGMVTYRGAPLELGTVVFHSQEGEMMGSAQIVNGQYSMRNAPVGACKVCVVTSSLVTEWESAYGVPKGYDGGGDGATPPKAPDMQRLGRIRQMSQYGRFLPQKYENPQMSGMTSTVPEGSSTHNIVLQ